MIKATELRIGLYFNVPRKDQCPFRIDEIEHLRENYAKVGMNAHKYKLGEIEIDGHPLTWELKDLSPIPLTEEWLLKFGFEKETYLVSGFMRGTPIEKFKKGNFYILNTDIINPNFGIGLHDVWDGIEITLKYLHQLQILYLALTNQELKLNP